MKLHELRATVRIVLGKDCNNWFRLSEIYSSLESRAIQSFLKALSPLIVGYLMASSLRSDNSIGFSVSSVDIFAPASFFLFFLSFAFLMTAVAFNHLSTAMSAKARLAGRMKIPGFSVNAFNVINERSGNGLGIPSYLNFFHKSILPAKGLLELLFLVVLVSVLLPIGAMGFFLISEQYSLASDSHISVVERISAAMGLVATVTAALFIVLFHLPLPMKKNVGSIRWSFLYWLPPHPSDQEKFERWRKDRP